MGHWVISERARSARLGGLVVLRLVDGLHRLVASGPRDVLDRGLVVVGVALALDDGQGAGGADVEAHAHAVAEELLDQDGLALVVQLQRAFVAGGGAGAAAVAEVAVYLDDLALGHACAARGS